jgi:hypothetical protein
MKIAISPELMDGPHLICKDAVHTVFLKTNHPIQAFKLILPHLTET